MIWLALPKPPSVNTLFATDWKTKRRFISKKYAEWIKASEAQLLLAKQEPIKGAVAVTITIRDQGGVDLANHEKATIDLLVKHGLIEGDGRKILRKLTMEWGGSDMKWGCEVKVEKI